MRLDEIITQTLPNSFTTECSEILTFYQDSMGKYLYRGIQPNEYSPIYKMDPPTNREPRNTDRWIHQLTNEAMDKQGLIATRKNSFFTTARAHVTTAYGSKYIVFPINGFKYSYSPIIGDYTLDLGDAIGNILEQNEEYFNRLYEVFTENDKVKFQKSLAESKFLKKYKYMAYIAIGVRTDNGKYDIENPESLAQIFKPMFINEIFPKLQYTNQGIEKLLNSHEKSEVMVHAPCYFIEYHFWNENTNILKMLSRFKQSRNEKAVSIRN